MPRLGQQAIQLAVEVGQALGELAVAVVAGAGLQEVVGKVERGDDSVQWSKLFQVLDQLGIRLTAEIPEQARALHEAETKKLETRRSEAN